MKINTTKIADDSRNLTPSYKTGRVFRRGDRYLLVARDLDNEKVLVDLADGMIESFDKEDDDVAIIGEYTVTYDASNGDS